MIEIRDEFLSEEDLDLRNLSEEELYAYRLLPIESLARTSPGFE